MRTPRGHQDSQCRSFEYFITLDSSKTGEHGVGVEKLNSMCVQFCAAENAQRLA